MPPVTENSPVTFVDPLPENVDVVIAGGGIIGISTAWFLAHAGVSVFVCEKGRVAGEQSSRNWGWVRQQGRDEAELPIMMDSINHWEAISRELGPDVGFERGGTLYLAATERELASFDKFLDIARRYQLDSNIIGHQEIEKLITKSSIDWAGALYTASDGHAEPFTAVPRMARHLQEMGVGIRENCAVRVLDTGAGKVSGVITEHGMISAPTVLCAGGAWSTVFLRNLGIRLPQLTVRATVARTAPCPDVFSGNAVGGGFAFRRRKDGGYTIAPGGINEHFLSLDSFRYFMEFQPALRQSARNLSLQFGGDIVKRMLPGAVWSGDQKSPFEETRVLDPAASTIGIARMRQGLAQYLPQLNNVPFVESWAGMIDVTPDVVPVMDEISQLPGLYIATGFSGHGFGFGPGAGEVMASMIMGHSPRHDLSRFRFSRFADGSKIVPGPGL